MPQPAIPSTSTCRNCGAPRPPTARFCPECGTRLDVEEVATPMRRFGAPPANLLLWLATAILAAAVVLLAVALWLPGIVLVFAAAIVAAAHAGRRHRSETSRALVRVRTRSRAVVETVAAQAQVRRAQLALRVELQRLLGERNDRLRALGEAVYREDAAGTEAARAALVELDGQVAAKEEQMTQIAERAQERVGKARLEAQSTLLLEPPPPAPPNPSPPPIPEPYPPPDEGTPPTPEPVPEPYPPPDEGDPPRQHER